MKEELYEWMKNLAVFYILFTALLHLVPDKKYEKYVRLFMGFLLIGMMCMPVFALIGKGEELLNSFQVNYEENKQLMEEEEIEQMQILYMNQGYETAIREKIQNALKNKGIKFEDIAVHIEGERVSVILYVQEEPDAEQERRVTNVLWEECGIREGEAVFRVSVNGEDTVDHSSASGTAAGSGGNAGIS